VVEALVLGDKGAAGRGCRPAAPPRRDPRPAAGGPARCRGMRRAWLILLLLQAGVAGAEEVVGSDAVFAGRGVAVLWGVVRGPDETRTKVVLRIERLDQAAEWRLVSLEAVDPFTREREWVRLALDLAASGAVTVEMSREGFLAKPTRRLLFFPGVTALQSGRPGLVVSYVSLPDTVPEFDSRAELDEHFARVRARLAGR
jgi:hypothetical protein